MSEGLSPLASFSGTARLFPLPNLVFFPQVLQPLHIFEPRYRQMTADALAGDRLIALVLPRPGWEADYAGSPALFSVATLGKIMADQELDDGRYNVLLRGLSRIQILHEIPHGKLYRKAKVDLLVETVVTEAKRERRLRQDIRAQLPAWFVGQPPVQEQFLKLLDSDLPLGALTDILAFALPLPAPCKQDLLEELDVERRLRKLLAQKPTAPATDAGETPRKFPPEFSSN